MVCITSLGWAGAVDDIKAGNKAAEGGEHDKAIRLFTKAIESGELSPKDLGIAYNYRGIAWLHKADNDKAIADFTKAIALDPKDADAYKYRGLSWQYIDDDKAIADYTKAIALNPKDAWAYKNRASAWYNKGDNDKAIADYTKAIEIDPQDDTAWYNRARTYSISGEKDKALSDLKRAIAFNESFKENAKSDEDFKDLWNDKDFQNLTE